MISLLLLTFVVLPDGRNITRIYRAFLVARRHKKEVEFIEAFSELVWGEGRDMGTDYGMKLLANRCDISFDEILKALYSLNANNEDKSILAECKSNQDYLLSRGLWGVPCLECDGLIVFGQDKLWVIEQILTKLKDNNNQKLSCNDDQDSELLKSIRKSCS